MSMLDKLSGDHGPLDIPFQPRDHLIPTPAGPPAPGSPTTRPRPTTTRQVIYRLEIETIRESINAYGLLTPVYLA